MKTFEEFWERCLEDEMFYNIDRSAALIAWEAATLAERERCLDICKVVEDEYFEAAPGYVDPVDESYYYGASRGADKCADTIRGESR